MSRLRAGLVGAGGIARSHVPAWMQMGAQVGVYSMEGSEELSWQFPGLRVFDTLPALVEWAEIVDVVTPTFAHAPTVETALRAGRDVICEKPIARTTQEAQRLLDLASGLGRTIFPAHVVRYFPAYSTMRTAVTHGTIGRPAISRFLRTGEFPTWSAWFGDERLSGGVILDLMIHDLDIARWVCGEVTEVFATLTRDRSATGSPVSVGHVVLTHAEGALSYVRGVWGPPGTSFWTSFHVAGDEGVLRYDSREELTVDLDAGANTATSTLGAGVGVEASPYYLELREFAEASREGGGTRVSAHDGLVAVELAEAAQRSADLGRPVRVGK